MRRYVVPAFVVLLSTSIVAYSLAIPRKPLFGFAAAAGLSTVYAACRHDEAEHAIVLSALWGVVVGAFWTARLDLMVGAILATAIVYAGWVATGGRGKLPG